MDGTLDAVFGEGMTEAYCQMQQAALDVIDLIKAGDTEEAVLRLEREFWPKWASEGNSRLAYLHHTLDNQEAAPQGAVG